MTRQGFQLQWDDKCHPVCTEVKHVKLTSTGKPGWHAASVASHSPPFPLIAPLPACQIATLVRVVVHMAWQKGTMTRQAVCVRGQVLELRSDLQQSMQNQCALSIQGKSPRSGLLNFSQHKKKTGICGTLMDVISDAVLLRAMRSKVKESLQCVSRVLLT